MVEICEHNKLAYDVVENETVHYDYVVFDVEEFSYDQILEELERRSKNKKTITHLGTYSSRLDCILLSFCSLKK